MADGSGLCPRVWSEAGWAWRCRQTSEPRCALWCLLETQMRPRRAELSCDMGLIGTVSEAINTGPPKFSCFVSTTICCNPFIRPGLPPTCDSVGFSFECVNVTAKQPGFCIISTPFTLAETSGFFQLVFFPVFSVDIIYLGGGAASSSQIVTYLKATRRACFVPS